MKAATKTKYIEFMSKMPEHSGLFNQRTLTKKYKVSNFFLYCMRQKGYVKLLNERVVHTGMPLTNKLINEILTLYNIKMKSYNYDTIQKRKILNLNNKQTKIDVCFEAVKTDPKPYPVQSELDKAIQLIKSAGFRVMKQEWTEI